MISNILQLQQHKRWVSILYKDPILSMANHKLPLSTNLHAAIIPKTQWGQCVHDKKTPNSLVALLIATKTLLTTISWPTIPTNGSHQGQVALSFHQLASISNRRLGTPQLTLRRRRTLSRLTIQGGSAPRRPLLLVQEGPTVAEQAPAGRVRRCGEQLLIDPVQHLASPATRGESGRLLLALGR